jgi:hypothetical protein
MAGFQSLARTNGSRVLENPDILQFPPFPKCYGDDCVTLDYRIIATKDNTTIPEWAQHTISYIAAQTGLLPQSDLIHNGFITNMSEVQSYYQGFKNRPNHTQIGLLFCNDKPEKPL